MTTILIIGAGCRHLALALGALHSVTKFVSEPECFGISTAACGVVSPALQDDPFSGGGRSKGEKKRAARQRRLMGGY